MLFVNDEELNSRISSPRNLVRVDHKLMHDKKRPVGAKEIPLDEKAAIGALAKVIGPSAAAEVADVSVSVASNAAKGVTTHGHGVNSELKEKVDTQLKKNNDLAIDLLAETLLSMNPEEIRKEKPKTQSEIAKNLATIIEKTGDQKSSGVQVNVQVYSPRISTGEEYPIIEVGPQLK